MSGAPTASFFGRSGSLVSPFGYLRRAEKLQLVNAYKQRGTEPYLRGETVTRMFAPYQPYLTNRLFLHRCQEGTHPRRFTTQALLYILISKLPRSEDAFNLGLRDQK